MSLDDVPVDEVGISWEQWMEQQRERIFAEARAKRRAASGSFALAGSPMLQENHSALACIGRPSSVRLATEASVFMSIGTKSVLFGAHCFFLHPLFVALAWTRLYGFPRDWRLYLAFFVHDL